MNKIINKILSKDLRIKIKKEKFPDFVKPMLAQLTHDYFNDPNWIYERKVDGERVLVFIKNGDVSLITRNEKQAGKNYPELVKAFKDKKPNMILDGEVVAFDGKTTSFQKLQARMHAGNKKEAQESDVKVYLYLFDIIHFDGYNLTRLPLIKRKQVLKKALKFEDPIRYMTHKREKGKEYHQEACQKGWEGIIAKDGESKYFHSRSNKWLKFKCQKEQELVIGGYTDPEGERVGFGALLVGYYEDNKLKYGGKVGTGYSDETLKRLKNKMKDLEVKESPFNDEVDEKDVHFIKPRLVGQFEFREWTKDNKLRHPAFKGLRRDKKPKEVTREENR